MKKTVFIIRHGETDLNREHIVQGSGVDSPLNELGHAQAKAFFENYQKEDFELVITSDLIRTIQTAQPFLDTNIPHLIDARIQEISWGIHEGMKGTKAMAEQYRVLMAEWKSGDFEARLEAGESAKELGQRVQLFVDELKQRPEERILVVSHGRTLACMLCLLQDQSMTEMYHYKHQNTGLTKAQFDGNTFTIILQNDQTHLEKVAI